MQFIIKRIKHFNPKRELQEIGFDKNYMEQAAKKHNFVTFKISNLPYYCATIIKQTALSLGADAGVHRDVLTHKVELSDVLLSGTEKQIENIAKSLSCQPFGLKQVSDEIIRQLSYKEKAPKIMGILNITENSSSDGGKFLDPNDAILHAKKLLADGADIIDIGAESTKANAVPVSVDVEIERLINVIGEIKKLGCVISVDTRNAKTAKTVLEMGADIINDVSGLDYDENMLDVIKNSNAKIVVMHSKGTPLTMDSLANYDNVCDEVYLALKNKIELLQGSGVCIERIIADVGFGFAKNTEQNFELLRKISHFQSLGVEILAGASRKRFLKSLTNEPSLDVLDDLSAISALYFFQNGANIVRVHNVEKTKLALEFYKKTIC